MFVYRDSADDQHYYPEPDAAAAAEREAEYWYGPADPAFVDPEPAGSVRGPFEPIAHHETGDPGQLTGDASDGDRGMVTPEPGALSEADGDEPADGRSRKLEQIKDFYLTAEAIGEENVGKHFDQLLAQQRELISEYFKQSATGRQESGRAEDETYVGVEPPAEADQRAGVEPTEAGAPGFP
jgi:hypothetical protein